MWRSPSVLLLAASLLSGACSRAVPPADSSRARERVANGALLLDVRTAEEFAAGHVEGAINLPVEELEARWSSMGVPPDREVVVYCRSGARSARATVILKGKGVEDVHDLGPMPDWK